MVEGLIGKKVGVTQTFDEQGNVVPVTIIKAGPCAVIQKKTREKDGYSAVQMCLVEDKAKKKANKPLSGHYSKAGLAAARILREFRFAEQGEVKEGDRFSVDVFKVGDKVDVTGTSKGKGFAGVVKRWGFRGGGDSHGSMFHRRPGSIGASAFPSRVLKGKKLPGQMGNSRVTISNLTVIETDAENNLLIVRGAVPGANGGHLLIKKAGFDPLFYKPEPRTKPEKPEAQKSEPQVERPEPEEKAGPESPEGGAGEQEAEPKTDSAHPAEQSQPEVSQEEKKEK